MSNYEYITQEELEETKFSNKVLAICAVNATMRVDGVVGFASDITDNISKLLFGKEIFTKGVKIGKTKKGVEIGLYVVIGFGYNIPDVVWQIQQKVRDEVEEITATKVAGVNVFVQHIRKKIYI
ncbi:MAG: Asp23/Gls24 family envelope stress response protein [Eubacteriales bacterium]|nr:Asp23/Gls24 family envelope stress response protein [Eubacteriales bacterium]MDY3333215.1 Asp23/Gls24 family envelope stress response protein [Gallibacter sp.]